MAETALGRHVLLHHQVTAYILRSREDESGGSCKCRENGRDARNMLDITYTAAGRHFVGSNGIIFKLVSQFLDMTAESAEAPGQ